MTFKDTIFYDAARRIRRKMRARAQAKLDAKSYHERTVIDAQELYRIRGARVLVVGAAGGNDCRLFVERGAAEVHGLDVSESVGSDFQHRRVRYHKAGIEKSGLEGNYFDLVFSVATMEHVPDIKSGFAEMVRLARPGGGIYSLAAPLWQSPYGHHMSCFDGHPWLHLAYPGEDIIAYAKSHGIKGDFGHPIENIVDYMLNPEFFNMKPGNEYVEACTVLDGIAVRDNELVLESDTMLDHPLAKRVLDLGYARQNLLATHHRFVATKI